MTNRKQENITTLKMNHKFVDNQVNTEWLYPGDITEFIDINLYSNLIYAVVLSTSYDEKTHKKSITTTSSSVISSKQIIRRVRPTNKTNKIIKTWCEHGQYMEVWMFGFKPNVHELNYLIAPPTDGMILKYIKDRSKKYAEKKIIF